MRIRLQPFQIGIMFQIGNGENEGGKKKMRRTKSKSCNGVSMKTCHQCKLKNCEVKMCCCLCANRKSLTDGKYCWKCLKNRYGMKDMTKFFRKIGNFFSQVDPNWICPKCLGNCNCRLCKRTREEEGNAIPSRTHIWRRSDYTHIDWSDTPVNEVFTFKLDRGKRKINVMVI